MTPALSKKPVWRSAYFWLMVFLLASLALGLFLLIAGMVTGLPQSAWPTTIAA